MEGNWPMAEEQLDEKQKVEEDPCEKKGEGAEDLAFSSKKVEEEAKSTLGSAFDLPEVSL